MATLLTQPEMLGQEQEDFATVSTAFNKQVRRSFLGAPIVKVHPVRSIAQTSTRSSCFDTDHYTENYYSPYPTDFSGTALPPEPYELGAIEDQSQTLGNDDIATHSLIRSPSEQAIRFTQPSLSIKRGKFVPSSNIFLSTALPSLPSRVQAPDKDDDLEDEAEPIWRGVFVVPHKPQILFSQQVEVKTNERSTWKPHVVVEAYRLEDDHE